MESEGVSGLGVGLVFEEVLSRGLVVKDLTRGDRDLRGFSPSVRPPPAYPVDVLLCYGRYYRRRRVSRKDTAATVQPIDTLPVCCGRCAVSGTTVDFKCPAKT